MSGLFKKYQIWCTNRLNSLEIFVWRNGEWGLGIGDWGLGIGGDLCVTFPLLPHPPHPPHLPYSPA
ncbi:MAG: hypothetical protein KME21_15115 [Desmonostoc vinosum HA7617-LM4]|nr:hypothetical protein [Desmonostoc vinosum HA7617-LM4]